MTLVSAPPKMGGPWWQSANALPRWLADLIRGEAQAMHFAKTLPAGDWGAALQLDEAGLGFDSLDRLHLAAAVSEALHMHESGVADLLLVKRHFGEWCALAEESLRRYAAKLTVRTSGSTGSPTAIPHAVADLQIEVEALAGLLFGGVTRVLSAVPSHHIYGFLFTILLPQRLGALPVLDIRIHGPSSLMALARAGDLIVGHPDFWAAAARAAPSGWPRGVTGVTSTAPCPAETAAALIRAGLSRLVEIHGSSETAGIGWRDDPRADYQLMPHWRRMADGRLLRGGHAIAAPDTLQWLDQRRYRIAGRIDGAVQVGGLNVFPARVRDVLCSHPAVAAASVRLMTPAEGNRLKAFIVPTDPAADRGRLHAVLSDFASGQLPVLERPRTYSFGPALPTNATGKLADWPLAAVHTIQAAGFDDG